MIRLERLQCHASLPAKSKSQTVLKSLLDNTLPEGPAEFVRITPHVELPNRVLQGKTYYGESWLRRRKTAGSHVHDSRK